MIRNKSKNIKKIIEIALTVCILLMLAGCGTTIQNTPANTPAINPKAEAANKDMRDVTLYFSYRGEELLAGETRKIEVPVSETLDESVIKALISGPSADRDELTGLFWPGVELVGVSSNQGILFVTLSDEFITSEPEKISLEDGSLSEQKKLAIYSIVNTMVEMGTYSSVQIYVDRTGINVRARMTRAEAGFGEETGAYVDQLGRDGTLILTPENTLREALESYRLKDLTSVYNFTAYTSPDGTIKPDRSAFADALSEQSNVLDDFSVNDANVSLDGQTAVVMLDYVLRTRTGETHENTNVPVLLVREDELWKISYSSLIKILYI